MSWLKHHENSETLAASAQVALNGGRPREAARLYADAARAEEAALAALDLSKARTFGITAVSAASLYYKAADYKRSAEIALQWLNTESLPAFAKEQLRDALRAATLQRHNATPPPSTTQRDQPVATGVHSMTDMLSKFDELTRSDRFSCVDRIELLPRTARLAPIPTSYCTGPVGRWLANDPKLNGQLWLHQAKAMRAAAQGDNVVVSTATASGKSLIFQSAVLRTLTQDGESTVIVFYPLKALAGDQLMSWRRIVEFAGLPDSIVAKIDGDVPRHERTEILQKARVVLLSPDVCHAWLLADVSNSVHRNFIARMALIVIDEAHILEGIFGSNFAYLFRRLCAARAMLGPKHAAKIPQVIAASATILNPEEHLCKLTGTPFVAIGENDNGSPSHRRSIVHMDANDGIDVPIVADILRNLADESGDGSFIAFMDSRQGVERAAIKVDLEDRVSPYRSGYESSDRLSIEKALRNGVLRGVVSTSALELGIDIAHFTVGINIGVPFTRKSFLQRLGRVGRNRPGIFAIFAEPQAFRRFGATLADYHRAAVEPSHLYLQNRFLQYAHARCLAEELDMLGDTGKKVLPSAVSWPDGFDRVFDFSYVDGRSARPREFDQIWQVGGDRPHYNYPLRAAPEEGFSIVHGSSGYNIIRIGQIGLQQAIRETFPGATYLHRAQRYRVHEWRNTRLERTIRVSPTDNPLDRRPVIRVFVNLSLDRDGIISGHYREGDNGFIAECNLQVSERVEGYKERGERKLYKDLQRDNPSMRPKTRDFRTTGIVLRISEAWFREKGLKQHVAAAFRDLMLREYSISAQDVDMSATNISIIGKEGVCQLVSDAVVFFDSTHGSLRLTEPLYDKFSDILNGLARSVDMSSEDDGLISRDALIRLRKWYEQLDTDTQEPNGIREPKAGNLPGWVRVVADRSIVSRRDAKGVFEDIEIVGREFLAVGGPEELYYRYKVEGTGTALMPARLVELAGDEWRFVYWNPETGEVRESVDGMGE